MKKNEIKKAVKNFVNVNYSNFDTTGSDFEALIDELVRVQKEDYNNNFDLDELHFTIKEILDSAKRKTKNKELKRQLERTTPKTLEPVAKLKKEKAEKKKTESKEIEKTEDVPAKKIIKKVKKVENEKAVDLASKFPDEIIIEDEVFKRAEKITKISQIRKLLEKDIDVVLAFYWTKRHIEQFSYFDNLLQDVPSEFENDLDITSVLHASEDDLLVYSISRYTEALYCILPNELEYIQNENIRISGGIEFEVYTNK